MDITTTRQTPASGPSPFTTEISATQPDRMLKKEEVERAFLGIIQLAKEKSVGMETLEESMTMKNPKCDQALSSQVSAVFREYDGVFP